MEDFLLRKISAITPEEERILSGDRINKDIYTENSDFIINSDRLTGGIRDISVRTHTRYTDFPMHKHNYLEIMIVLSGNITHRISGETITLGVGDILILNKHVSHSIDKVGTPDIGVNIIISDNFVETLSKELAETVFSELARENSKKDGAGIYLCFSSTGNKEIENIIENLLFELTEFSADMRILKNTTALLFDYLSRKSSKLLKIASKLPDKNDMRQATILGYIRSNYRQAKLTELADLMFLSAPYLSKIIHESFGKSFKELLIEERLKRAYELAEKTDITIGDIIGSVGYENESYFHREFKNKYGKSPLAVRRKREENKGI